MRVADRIVLMRLGEKIFDAPAAQTTGAELVAMMTGATTVQVATMTATTMPIVGYGDRWSVQPGETLHFMVSAEAPRYQARVVRLIHGDTNPAGPGFQVRPVASSIEGDYQGVQHYHPGSFAVVPDAHALQPGDGLTLSAWVFPTTRGGPPGDPGQMGRSDPSRLRPGPRSDRRPRPLAWRRGGRFRRGLDRTTTASIHLVSGRGELRLSSWVGSPASANRAVPCTSRRWRRKPRPHLRSNRRQRALLTIGAWSAGTAVSACSVAGSLTARSPRPKSAAAAKPSQLGFRARFRL